MSRQGRLDAPIPRLALRGALELAAALGVSEDHARSFAHEIPAIRRGRVTLYPIANVQAWLEANAERVLSEVAA
jgi:hypothetical protein